MAPKRKLEFEINNSTSGEIMDQIEQQNRMSLQVKIQDTKQLQKMKTKKQIKSVGPKKSIGEKMKRITMSVSLNNNKNNSI